MERGWIFVSLGRAGGPGDAGGISRAMAWKGDPRWAYALVNLATLFWASNMALGRLLHEEIGPFTLTAARFTIAAVFLTAMGLRLPAPQRTPGSQWPLILGMGLTGVFGFSSLLYSGLRFTTATNAALINGAGPLIIGLMAAMILREPLRGAGVVGAVISLTGVAVIVSRGSLASVVGGPFNVGDLLVLVAVLTWGLYSVMARVATRSRSALTVTWLSTCMALPLLYPAALWEWQTRPATISVEVVLAVLYIGIFPSLVSVLAWNEGVRRVGPERATVFYNMLPVFGTLIGVLWLGEAFSLAHFLGGGLILLGSMVGVWADLRRRCGG